MNLTLAALVVLALVMAKIFSIPAATAGQGTAIVFGLYFGLLGAVGIYHLLMYAVLGGKDFLAYGVYVAALALMQLTRSQYYAWFFSGVHIPKTVVGWFAYALFSVAAYWLFQSLLLLPLLQPRINRILRWLTGAAAVLCLAAPWLHIAPLIEAISVIALLFVFYAAWRALQRGLRAARYFIVAFAGMFAGGIATLVSLNFGTALPAGLSSLLYGFQIGTVFQALALALGIADRIQVANEERDRTQRHALEETTSLNVAYARFVPRTFLELLGKTDIRDVALGDQVQSTMTIFFSDIRSFTALSETMTPAQTFAFINELLSRTGPIVREHDGVIDKYIGDAIMALFPHSADDAVNAGIAVQQEVALQNHVRAQTGLPPIAVGIGLHTGKLMLGTIGEHERMDGTVIADAVNLASRIESLTKTYGAAMMISDATRDSLRNPSDFDLRFVGRVAVKGKSDGVGLYEVLDAEQPAVRERRCANATQFDRAVTLFCSGEFSGAESAFALVIATDPDDRAATFLRTRCAELTASDVPWDGVDHLTFK